MADKRISQLVDRGTVLNNDVVPIVVNGAITTNKATISSIQTFMQGNLDLGVTSVGITLGSSGTDVSVTGSPITTSGNMTINIPDASATARGVVNTNSQTFAGAKTFVSDIVANGVNVGKGAGTGVDNVRVGANTLIANTTGANNTAVGARSLQTNTIGQNNTAVGLNSLQSNAGGSNNTSVGLGSLNFNTSGSNNVALGTDAGRLTSTSSTLLIANNSIFIGEDTRSNASNETNQIVIGHEAIGQGSNTVTIGNSSITSNKFFGRVIHADAVNADESATLGQVNTSLGGFVTLNTAQTITAQKTINRSGGDDTLIVNHTSGGGRGINITKDGNGEALRIHKGSGSGNAVYITGGSFEAQGGIFSGDLQSNTRLIASTVGQQVIITPNLGAGSNRIESTGSLPMALVSAQAITLAAGGVTPQFTLSSAGAVTLTGALNGTSAVFSGDVTSGGASQNLFIANGNTFSGFKLSRAGVDKWAIFNNNASTDAFDIFNYNLGNSSLTILPTGAATFSSSVTAGLYAINRNGSDTIASSFYQQDTLPSTANAINMQMGASGGFQFHTFNGSWNNRMTITSTGNVGIGTATPARKLSIEATDTWASFKVTGNREYLIGLGTSDAFRIFDTTADTERMRISSAGNVGIGTSDLTSVRLRVKSSTTGNSNFVLYTEDSSSNILFWVRDDGLINTGLRSASPYNNSTTGRSMVIESSGSLGYLVSTRESKANIESIKNVDFISQLNPVQFNYRKKDSETNEFKDELYENVNYGFIADEVESVNKELVFYNEDGTLAGVEYNNMIAILTKAIQELKTEIDSLKNQIK